MIAVLDFITLLGVFSLIAGSRSFVELLLFVFVAVLLVLFYYSKYRLEVS